MKKQVRRFVYLLLPLVFLAITMLGLAGQARADARVTLKTLTAPATHFAVSALANATIGIPFSFTVTAQTSSNTKVDGYIGNVNFASSDTAASLPAATVLTNGAGAYITSLDTAGDQAITATDLSNSIEGTSSPITVSPAINIQTLVGPGKTAVSGLGNPFSTTTAAVTVTGVTISPRALNLTVGATSTLAAPVAPSNANQAVTWSSDNTGVATVDQSSGVVTAVAPGYARITATTVGTLSSGNPSTDSVPVDVTAATTSGSGGGTTPSVSSQTVLHFHIGRTDSDINGLKQLLDTAPIISKGRTFLPIKFVAGPLGATTRWDEAQQMITVTLSSKTIQLWIGKSTAMVNGASVPIDPGNPGLSPMIVTGRTMLPLAFIAANLGCKVGWDANTSTVTVTRMLSTGATVRLSSLAIGDTVQFAGYTWDILDPSTGFLLMQSAYGSDQAFDSDNFNTFDPTHPSNIAYYLNNTFYNSLSPADQALIQFHTWNTGAETKESSSTAACYVGLVSYSALNNYIRHVGVFSMGSFGRTSWWTLTPCSGTTHYDWCVLLNLSSPMFQSPSMMSNAGVCPALYLNPDVSVSGGNGGIVTNS